MLKLPSQIAGRFSLKIYLLYRFRYCPLWLTIDYMNFSANHFTVTVY